MTQSDDKLRALGLAVLVLMDREAIKAMFAQDGFERVKTSVVSDVFSSPYGQLEIDYQRRDGHVEALRVMLVNNDNQPVTGWQYNDDIVKNTFAQYHNKRTDNLSAMPEHLPMKRVMAVTSADEGEVYGQYAPEGTAVGSLTKYDIGTKDPAWAVVIKVI